MNAQSTDIQIPLYSQSEIEQLHSLIELECLHSSVSTAIQTEASDLVQKVRSNLNPSILEQFLQAYPLNTPEGLSLMALAEAYQRVPDKRTANALILDKLQNRDWTVKGSSSSRLVQSASLGLQISSAGLAVKPLQTALLGVMRLGIGAGMRLMGRAFVLGQTLDAAQQRATRFEKRGYTFSYDMLGEAAYTQADADHYFEAYRQALVALIASSAQEEIAANPGISVKLSALHPRYELFNEFDATRQLTERMLSLCILAKQHKIGLNIDAEECARLELSLGIIRNLIEAPQLAGWDGLGIVVQAYNRKAYSLIDQLYAWAEASERKLMVRLVKGAYWDTEIKLAQEQGLDQFPVFTAKHHTDISYLACARKLVRYGDRIYPQFATHNAQSAACVLNWAKAAGIQFEMQRLHGMGEAVHQQLIEQHNTGCRIYAPVGSHKDLLAYLVRRLLENGANSSFVSQLADESLPADSVVSNPVAQPLVEGALRCGTGLYSDRRNSQGVDLGEQAEVDALIASRSLFMHKLWGESGEVNVYTPHSGQAVGAYTPTNIDSIPELFTRAHAAQKLWQQEPGRGELLRKVADLYERDRPELLALLAREAGKTLADAVNEIREAVDFLRYYANQSDAIAQNQRARGVVVCISPWNFPLAIFTGQIAAALGAGNAVLAKPAEQTTLIARKAVELWHEAGTAADLLQLIQGRGATQGAALVSQPQLNAVLFTGSTATAQRIEQAIATNARPDALLVAETGGLNAMVADATALPEQVVKAVITSAFKSAGQRCSALRMLYVQRDVYPQIVAMIKGAMALLKVGDPSLLATDLGAVIDAQAAQSLNNYIADHQERVLFQTALPDGTGHFVAPTLIEVSGIDDLDVERFGPILHIAPYEADQLESVIAAINARGYGLTFAIHSRIESRSQALCRALHVGNCYINRNQIGAVVGSQPFGGEGLSGTGPKAGGPHYLANLLQPDVIESDWQPALKNSADSEQLLAAWRELQARFSPTGVVLEQECPGVTGERNRLYRAARGYWLVAGDHNCWSQAVAAAKAGNPTLVVCADKPETALDESLPLMHLAADLPPGDTALLDNLAGISLSASPKFAAQVRSLLAQLEGRLRPVLTDNGSSVRHYREQHICEDTTASGGNTALMMGQGER